jgi:hypothetical protein
VADIVGTAFVTVRAITTGVKKDIQRGIDKGVKDAQPAIKRAGTRIGQNLGQGIQVGLTKSMSQIDKVLTKGLGRHGGAAQNAGRILGRRIGRGIGHELSLEIRRVPIAPFLLAGLAPALAGGLKVIAAFIGSATSFIAPLGPAFVAATTSAAAGVTALGQAGLSMLLAWKAEGPVLDAFKKRMTGIKEEFFEVGKAIQGVLFDPLADSIDRMVSNLLPALREGLIGTGRVLAGVSVDFARLSSDPVFQGNFATILSSNNRVLASFGKALVSVTDAASSLLVAAGPMLEFFAEYIRTTAGGWRDTLRLAQETGRLAGFFERAQATLQQLGRIGENVRIALSNTFKSASGQAEGLWQRFETLTEKWRTFTESVRGQRVMDRFFAESTKVTTEVSGLFGDMFRLIGRGLITSSDSLVNFIRAIRFEVLPAVTDMSRAFAGLAPVLTSLVVNIANFFATLANTGVLTTFMNTLSGAFQVLETMLSLPIVGTVAGWTLGFIAFGRALNIATLGAFTRLLTPLGGMLLGLAGSLVGVGKAALGAGGFISGLKVAAAGLLAVVSPIGLALTGVAVILGFFIKQQLDARQAAQQHEAALAELVGTIDQTTGAVTELTAETVASQLVESDLDDTARSLGVSLQTVTEAALGNADAQAELNGAIREARYDEASAFVEQYGGSLTRTGDSQEELTARIARGGDALEQWLTQQQFAGTIMPAQAAAIRELGGGYSELSTFVQDSNRALEQGAADLLAQQGAAQGAVPPVDALAAAMGVLSDNTSSADEKARALNDALLILAGTDLSLEQAQSQANAAVDRFASSAGTATAMNAGLSAQLVDTAGKIDTTTQEGRDLFDSMLGVTAGMATAAQGAYDNAVANGRAESAMDEATVAAQGVYDSFIDAAVGAGISRSAAEALARQYGLIPENVSTTISASDRASSVIRTVQGLIANIPREVSVNIYAIQHGVVPRSGVAKGGILHPGGRLTPAASGLLAKRQAMIAQGGSNIIWAEPETENESYIPHSRSKRRRATKVLAQTAQVFGYGLHAMAEGGLTDRSLDAGSRGTNARETVGDVINISVDGPEVLTRARALAEEIEIRRRRASALRGRVPR